MNKDIIKQIIVSWQETIPTLRLVERKFEFEPNCCQVLVGLRRAGKSFLLYQYIKQLVREGHSMQEVLFINFEDERLADMTRDDLHLIVECYKELYAHKPYIFLDEIQNIDGWQHFARRLADEKQNVIITGSNAKMLSRDMAATLGGRYVFKEVFPFSFKEFLDYRHIELHPHWRLSPQRAQIVRLMNEYLHQGGLSECFDLVDKRGWLQSLYERILLADLVVRNNIRNERGLRLLTRKLADSVMQPTGIKRLQNIIQGSGTKISRETISDYLTYLHDAYLTFGIANYRDNLAERASIQKHYFYDNGILGLFIINPEPKLLENLVALYLYKRYGERLYYYNRQIEVDFVVASESETLLVQASWSVAEEATRRREVDALVKAAHFFEMTEAYIITFNEEETLKLQDVTIHVVPIYCLLLEPLR